MAEQLCASCQEPLSIEVEPDSDFEDSKAPAQIESVPDDVELSCGCHYHCNFPLNDSRYINSNYVV